MYLPYGVGVTQHLRGPKAKSNRSLTADVICGVQDYQGSKGWGPENFGSQEGEADSQGSGHAVRRFWIGSRHGCIEGRVNVLLSSVQCRLLWRVSWCCIVLHARGLRKLLLPTSSGDFQGTMRENGQLGTYHHGMGVTIDRRLRAKKALRWGRYRLGLLSVTFSFH